LGNFNSSQSQRQILKHGRTAKITYSEPKGEDFSMKWKFNLMVAHLVDEKTKRSACGRQLQRFDEPTDEQVYKGHECIICLKNEKRVKELEEKIEDICCDLQEGAKLTEGRSKKLREYQTELTSILFISKQEGEK
jgi:hypothetical protein